MGKASARGQYANQIDSHVGTRLRRRRQALRMTQRQLADALGITAQQLSKYESGANRIGSSRLYQVAEALQIPVSWFFDDRPGPLLLVHHLQCDPLQDFLRSEEGMELNQAFGRIADAEVRRRLVDLVLVLSEAD